MQFEIDAQVRLVTGNTDGHQVKFTLVFVRNTLGMCKNFPVVYYHTTREFLVCNKDGFYQAAISMLFNRFCEVVESYMILWTKDRHCGIKHIRSVQSFTLRIIHFCISCSPYSVTKWPHPNISRELWKRGRTAFIALGAPSCWKFSS